MNNYNIKESKFMIMNRKENYIQMYICLCLCLFLVFIIMGLSYSYPKYLNYYGQIVLEDDSYYVKLYIKEKDIATIGQSELLINSKKYKYTIFHVSNEYSVDEKLNKYYGVYMKINLDSKLVIENNIINMYFELPKDTFFRRIVTQIRKGMM